MDNTDLNASSGGRKDSIREGKTEDKRMPKLPSNGPTVAPRKDGPKGILFGKVPQSKSQF